MNALININITETEDERQVNISTYDGKKVPWMRLKSSGDCLS